MAKRKLDSIDIRILAELQRNAKLTNVELAEAVNLSPSPCLARVKALEKDGIISRYTAIVNPVAVGLNVNVFIRVRLEKQSREILASFEHAIRLREEVLDCYLMSGEADYLLRVVVPDVASLEKLTIDHLSRIPGVANIQSSFALKEVKMHSPLPVH